MKIDRETFAQQRSPRFGRTNPQRIRLAFWEAMAKAGKGPYEFRKEFELGQDSGPIWCFSRMGQTRTELPDGRTICVGGEFEAFYDPDFCIYNDVIILYPDGNVKIFGYPKEIFPPNDFHTASLLDKQIIIIGGLGYPDDRRQGFTPVYGLDLWTFKIQPIATHGEPPGWIYHHKARIDPSGDSVTVWGGKIILNQERWQKEWLNLEEYRLHLVDQRWERITDRSCWRQFHISPAWTDEWSQSAPPKAVVDLWCHCFPEKIFWPEGIAYEVASNGPLDLGEYHVLQRYEIAIDKVNIFFVRGFGDSLRVIVKGTLPDTILTQFINAIQANLEAVGGPCSVQSCH